MRRVIVGFGIVAVVAAGYAAPTQAPGYLYVGAGVGPYAYFDCCNIHVRTVGEFGIHFSNDETGFFLAFEAAPTFGDDFFLFLGGVRLGGDIEVYGRSAFALILRPSGLLGGGALDFHGPERVYGFFGFQPAFDIRLSLADRLLTVWVRPVAFDILVFPNRDVSAAYQLLGGLDFNFG